MPRLNLSRKEIWGLLAAAVFLVAMVVCLGNMLSEIGEKVQTVVNQANAARAEHPCTKAEVRIRDVTGAEVCVPGRRP